MKLARATWKSLMCIVSAFPCAAPELSSYKYSCKPSSFITQASCRPSSCAIPHRSALHELRSAEGEFAYGEVCCPRRVRRRASARRGGGLRHHAVGVREHAAQPRQPAVPGPGVLHIRRLHRRRQHLPGVRHHRQRGRHQARARCLLRPDLARDHRRDERRRRPVPMGLLLQGRDKQGHVSTLLWTGTHPIDRAVQLRSRRESHREGPGEQPGPGVHGRGGVLQDGHVVLDDGAGQQAVVPQRRPTPLDADGRRHRCRPGARIRSNHQHH